WNLDQPPDGFTFKGRYAVTPPDTRAFQQPLDEPKRVAVEVSDVWVRGTDVLIMEQGVATSERGVFTARSFSEDVELGPLGLSAPMVELAERTRPHERVTYKVADLFDVAGPFDLVFSSAMLHHVRPLEPALEHLRSLVAPGGLAVLVDVIGPSRWHYRVANRL